MARAGCRYDRVSSVTDLVTGATGYTFGIGGARTTMTLPGGGTWTYRLGAEIEPKDDPNSFCLAPQEIQDDQGRIVDFGFGLHGEVCQVISNKVYSTGGALQSYCEADYYPEGCPFGVAATPGAPGLLKEVQNRYAQFVNGTWVVSQLSDNVYSMDTAGNRVANQVTDNTGTIRTEQYGYDEINRLTSVNYGDGQTQTYSFDAMGNRLQKADSVTGTENYSFNAANMLLTRGTNNYVNDADGNTLTGGGRTNSWDSQNRMVQCVNGSNTSTYVYGADGYRHHSTVNGVTTDFGLDCDSVVRELRTGTSYATYFTGRSGPMYRLQNTNGTIRWYFYDGLGSVLGEVDPGGTVTTYARYDVYGMVRSRTGTATTAHGFVGQLGHTSEAEASLIYMRARFMDPAVGRFVSEDPEQYGANWYQYGGANPVVNIDASGKKPEVASIYTYVPEWSVLWTNAGNICTFFALMALKGLKSVDGAAAFMALAVICYTLAAIGLPCPQADFEVFVGLICSILSLGASGWAVFLARSKDAEQSAGRGAAMLAIDATIAHGLILYGEILSIGLDA